MSVESRPHVGTWRLNNRQVVKVTPDALVYLNGDLAIPGCPTCNGRIDVQKYVTQVSADPSTEGPATASVSLSIPRHIGDPLFRDGNFVLRPGLEIHIYFRGYFATKGLTAGVTSEQVGGLNVQNAVMYPYYMVFHGVVTEVNHEYSGGEHTASLSCADLLHFWQYQRMSTNGSAFGPRPTNSKVKMSLIGHNFTGKSPYSIIYQLYRDVQGSAGGVEFALGNKTNSDANSSVLNESLFSLSILYWQKRFSQTVTSLRMYGADGQLYNAFQAAFLASLNSSDPGKIAKKYPDKNANSYELDPLVRASRASGFDPFSVGLGAEGKQGKEGQLGVNVAQLQAFVSDVSQWGNVNLFESQYATKLEIANTVKEASGFEFYQDVDGDIVFKPPFYNLDTSADRVYRIEEIDVISFSASEKEPEATVVKATGGHFQNLKIGSLENNEFGTRAEFVDYRMVAQFGWRQQTFETSYHTNPQAMFFACVARYDLFNIGVKSASCQIPLRPELRPGYPVYIAPLDCYYYVHSFNHSFSFGGQCTTTLNLVGKRAKFFAPGEPPLSGGKATVDNIRLGNTHLPPLPLEIDDVEGESIVPRLQGFPNVVMTLDPEQVNPLSFAAGVPIDDLNTEDAIKNLIDAVRFSRFSPLQQSESGAEGVATDEASRSTEGPFKIQTGPNSAIQLPSVSALLDQAKRLQAAYASKDPIASVEAIKEELAPLQALIEAARDTHSRMFPEADSSATYLELLGDLKAAYNPGKGIPGYYRYYSSSHPDADMQGPRLLDVDPETRIVTTGSVTKPDESVDQTAIGFQKTASGGNTLAKIPVLAGIPILSGTGQVISTPTHQITTFQMAQVKFVRNGTKAVSVGEGVLGFPRGPLSEAYHGYFWSRVTQVQVGLGILVSSFQPTFDLIANLIAEKVGVTPVFPGSGRKLSQVSGDGVPGKLARLAREMADACATAASRGMLARQQNGEGTAVLGEAWAAIWPEGSQVQTGIGTKQKSKPKLQEETHNVPVFPVSDARGYEVIGTYRYGRGLRLDQIDALSGFSETDVDYDRVEQFILSIKDSPQADYAKAIQSLSAAERALLASTSQLPELKGLLEESNPGGTQAERSGRNWQADTRESTQKNSIVNAAYGLADLTATVGKRNVCSCKGAEADVLLMAFDSSLFVDVDQVNPGETEQVQDWLSDQMVAASVDWAARQAAYRGQVLDTNSTGLFPATRDALNNYENLLGRETPALPIGDVQAAAQAAEAAFDDFGLEEEG